MINRRMLLLGSATLGVGALVWWSSRGRLVAGQDNQEFTFVRTEAEWKKLLPPDAYRVLREEATERPYTSSLLTESRDGKYVCRGCELPLYSSADKFDSKTGWPSFTRAINKTAVGTRIDHKLILPRTEVHCSRCGGHLGHVFDDGPPPTGLRHCINGVALKFVVAA